MKRLGYLFMAVMSMFGAQAIAQNEFTVKGNLRNVEDGAVIILSEKMGNVERSVTDDTVRNGQFNLKWQAGNEIQIFSLGASVDARGFASISLNIWVKAGSVVEISGNDKYMYTWDVKSDVPQQAEMTRFIGANRENWIEFQRLSAQKNDMRKDARDMPQKKRVKVKAAVDSLNKLEDAIMPIIYRREIELLEQGPVTDIGLRELGGITHYINYSGDDALRPQAEAVYDKLDDAQKNSRDGKSIYAKLYPPQVVKAGDQMADADLRDLEGNKRRLSDFKGKFILLDFWSMGCGPCIAAMPEMKELTEKYGDRLAIVSLSIDNDKAWKEASAVYDITWNNLSDGMEMNGIAAAYGVASFPHYTMISPEGVIVESWAGYGKNSLRRKMQEHIK